jgi:DNA polymerase I-like protein with 3'-5' exonuclease and polymerase domains
MKPASKDAHRLFLQGSVALSKIEAAGLPIDMEKLAASHASVDKATQELSRKLKSHEIFQRQRKIYGTKCSIGSREQLGTILFDHMRIPGATRSAKSGKYVMDVEALERINSEYVDWYVEYMQLQKIKTTYLNALTRDTIDGRLRGFFNLHNVKSFRGSSDSPNLNNLPSRRPELTRYVKGCVSPPKDYYIVESDYSSLEVHVAACYNKDPTLIGYLENDYDMHRAVSKQCYIYQDDFIEQNPKLAKVLRQATKSDAVFSWFYGNYYKDITLRLWKTATNNGMLDHLATNGIKRLGLEFDHTEGQWIEIPGEDAFVSHIKSIEDDFWNVRYKVYNQWRKSWFANYLARGFFHTLTGFAWYGVEKRNFVINCPIQGSAFHCLLQAIIDIQAEIERTKMNAEIVCEIHDSIVAIVHRSQLHDYVAMANEIMTTKLRKKWPWLILRLKTETEVSPVSWADKQPYTGTES